MKPLITIRRKGRWLMAAGLALASLAPTNAGALMLKEPELKLDRLERVEPEPGRITPFFEKVGRQRGCDYVEYRLRFGVKGSPEALAHPAFADTIKNFRMDLADQMPNGLTVISVNATGDGTDAVGGALPSGSIDITADPNDTAKLNDFRLSATDLDGSGEADRHYVDVRIVARIDPLAFPVPTLIDNQGWVRVTRPAGAAVDIPSQDPAEPDDGDFLTGAKTTILVDLTGCDRPPPPPTGEPCFEVVTGEVDCVPGGGAFIYHMPVGPELGGKWVQLRTTTPGVTVAPAMQLAPGGGGVLNWTITGALPGDTVHLIVTGIETYAGPEEGVGLCCTQTVDIEIPPDLDCPDKEREPDLKVQKRADVAQCTKEGGCNFTIRVTNVGDAPYNGKIVLDEVTAPGNAAVESGPNAPWTCVPMASPMSCEHPATTLNPGEWVELKLGFEPGPAWDWGAIRNCAEYDYTASGKELFGLQTNDKACASIPICIPGRDRECTPIEKKVDLTIRKQALNPVCSLDGVCLWRIDIINSGTETINGPLTVSDTYPAGIPASSMFEPTPPWVCGPDGPGAFTCQHPGMVLVPGASTPIFVRTIVGDGFDRDQIENCAEVKPVPGETNLANNKSCAKARVPNRDPGKPAMRITKTCAPAVAGAAISCHITVVSVGTAAPSGPVRVNDAAELIGAGTPVQIQTVTPDGAEWSCGPVPADTLSCQIPGAVMTPGTSRYFDVTLNVSANQRFENCARGSYGPAPGDDIVYPIGEACAQGGSTIKVEKTGDQQCVVGQPCTFEITIRNEGDAPFNGTVQIGDAMEVEGFGRLEGVAISEISPPFGCSPEPATLPISCDANLSLGAGEARVHQVTVVIPDDGRFDNLTGEVAGRNCVAVLAPGTPVRGNGMEPISRGDGNTKTDLGDAVACHSFMMSKQEQQKQCSEGLVMDANGRCGCPEGTTFRNGKCTGGSTTPPPPVKDPETPRQCKLLPGQVRTDDGRCVCPNGTELKNGACRRIVTEEPPVRQCKLLPGQIRTNSGRCICPKGTELKNGACRRIVADPPPTRQCTLLPGQVRTRDGKCVCPRGTRLVGKACRTIEKPVECKKGQRLINGRCVTVVPPRKCPTGTVGTPPNCRQVQLREPPKRLINPDVLRKILPLREPSKRPATNNVQ